MKPESFKSVERFPSHGHEFTKVPHYLLFIPTQNKSQRCGVGFFRRSHGEVNLLQPPDWAGRECVSFGDQRRALFNKNVRTDSLDECVYLSVHLNLQVHAQRRGMIIASICLRGNVDFWVTWVCGDCFPRQKGSLGKTIGV